MKTLSPCELKNISAGTNALKFVALGFIRTVEHAFDLWKESRERKVAKAFAAYLRAETEFEKNTPLLLENSI